MVTIGTPTLPEAGVPDTTTTIVYAGGGFDFDVISRKADGAVTPGAVLEHGSSDGELKEGTAAAACFAYAVENDFKKGGTVLDDYADGDPVRARQSGYFYGLLEASVTTQNPGTELECAGSGELRVLAAGKLVAKYVGRAPTGSAGAKRILCKFMG